MGDVLSREILKTSETVGTLFWLLRELDEEYKANNDFLEGMSSEKWFWHC